MSARRDFKAAIALLVVLLVGAVVVNTAGRRVHVRDTHAAGGLLTGGGLAKINTTGNCTGTGSSGAKVDCTLHTDGVTMTGTGSAGDPFSADISLQEFEFAGLFGSGLDGDVTVSADTSLSKDMMYQNLTVDAGKTLTTNGWRIFVRDTLTLNGVISAAGANGTVGNNGSSAIAACASVAGGSAGTSNIFPGGAAGGASANGAPAAGGAGGSSSASVYASNSSATAGAGSTTTGNNGTTLGGVTGRGGGGGSGGGFGGTASSAGGAAGITTCSFCGLQHEYLSATSNQQTDASGAWNAPGTGGGGGSCGRDTTSSTQTEAGGGGGGAGGGWAVVQTKKVVMGGSAYFDVRGGNGGNGGSCGTHAGNSGGGGGGGGGAGGILTLVLGAGTMPSGTQTKFSGGSGGTGGTACAGGANGGNGGTGSNGHVIAYKAGY